MPSLKQLWDEHNEAGKPLPLRVTCDDWEQSRYLDLYYFDRKGRPHGLDENGNSYTPIQHTYKDWQLYTPPKPKVERWLWVYESCYTKPYCCTEDRWMTEHEAMVRADQKGHKLIGKDPNCKEPLVTDD